MEIQVVAFGSLTEILNKRSTINAVDTESLLAGLTVKYPSLQGRKILMAVNERLIKGNTILNVNDTVALMSPYSGG